MASIFSHVMLIFVAIMTPQIQATINFTAYNSCRDTCSCIHGNDERTVVRCYLRNWNSTTGGIVLPLDIYELDLSDNGLDKVPTNLLRNYSSLVQLNLDNNLIENLTELSFFGLSSLKSLSLRQNRIYHIYNNSLAGLHNLRTLNLAMNNIHFWDGDDLSRDIPLLEQIEITDAIFWVPDVKLLKLRMLREIIGVTWCKWCKNCTLVQTANIVNDTIRKNKAESCTKRFQELKYLEIGKTDPKRFFAHGYIPECMCVKQTECEFRQLVMPHFQKRTTLPQYLFILEYFISPFTIIFNIIVIGVVMSSSALRGTPSFVLIANMAVVDTLVGIYAISVANVNIKEIKQILEELMWAGHDLRPSTGPIFIAGQLISASIALLLTVERYITVVYCMKPNTKMDLKATVISLAVAWGIAIAFSILPIFGVAGLHYNIKRACAPLSYDVEYQSESSTVLLTFLVLIILLYFANMPLYIRIFHFVKKASNQAGIKRELSLARKIAILILTNFIFFAIPILLILVFSIFAEFDNNPFDFDGDAFESTMFKMIIGQWLPVTCLNINALLDPFLYAFRHTLFKRHISRLFYRCTGKVLPLNDSVLERSVGSKVSATAIALTTKPL